MASVLRQIFHQQLEANRFTVTKVLELARTGALRVPAFQRPLRWRRADHLLLLDSLYRGYPVGTLLLWKRAAERATVVFGDHTVPADAMAEAFWIVDGQQRITSIAGCLLRSDDPPGRRSSEFAFWFDLEEDAFVRAGEVPTNRYIPVNRLGDPVATSKWAREVGAGDELHAMAQAVGARLRAYEIPAYITIADSDDVLRTIFQRANTAGKQMRWEEVFEALNKGLKPSDSPQGLTERLRDVVLGVGFGTVETDYLQRALIAVAGHNPAVRLPEALSAPGAALPWEARTAEGLRRTAVFLRDEAGLPHAHAMPYSLPLILLPRFFDAWPEPGERAIELLVRWVWRGIAGQSHMATNQQFNPHHKAFGLGSAEGVARAFLALVTPTMPTPLPESVVYNGRGMKTRLELAVLYGLAPRSLVDGHELAPVEVFEADRPEPTSLFAPPASGSTVPGELPRLPMADRTLHRVVAARFLHPELRGRDAAFAAALQEAPEEVLRSHGITASLTPLVRKGAWVDVVRGRAVRIRALVRETIVRHARWGEDDDGPSVEALLADLDEHLEAP